MQTRSLTPPQSWGTGLSREIPGSARSRALPVSTAAELTGGGRTVRGHAPPKAEPIHKPTGPCSTRPVLALPCSTQPCQKPQQISAGGSRHQKDIAIAGRTVQHQMHSLLNLCPPSLKPQTSRPFLYLTFLVSTEPTENLTPNWRAKNCHGVLCDTGALPNRKPHSITQHPN